MEQGNFTAGSWRRRILSPVPSGHSPAATYGWRVSQLATGDLGYRRRMARSWTHAHPKSVTATGAGLVAVVVAGLVATVVGAVAIAARSYGPLVVAAVVVGLLGLVVSVPALWHLARTGRLGPARPAGGVGEEDAKPAADPAAST